MARIGTDPKRDREYQSYVQQKTNDGTPYLNQGNKTKTGTPEGQEYTALPRNFGAGAQQTGKKQYQPQGAGMTQDPYAAQANALYQQLMNRGPFTYDLQGDMLYRQYADQYSQLGRQAMMDATGTAAGLTGGYGNSYANLVGNQAYQQYMGQLNAMIPDFYDRAYQRWLDQGDLMLQQYQLAAARAGGSGGGGQAAGSVSAEAPDVLPTFDRASDDGWTFADYVRMYGPQDPGQAFAVTPQANMQLATEWYKQLLGKGQNK